MNRLRPVLHLLRFAFFVGILLWRMNEAHGQTVAPKPSPSGAVKQDSSDKVDIKDLENQYWAPKDTDFSVVQNRTYSKEHRFAVSAQYGPLLNDKYNDGNILMLSGNYYFNERYGIQLDYQKANLGNNSTVNYFINHDQTAPDFTRMTGYYGIGFNYIPIYAKMSLLNSKIIYFDFAITPMIGITNYNQILQTGTNGESSFTYGFDVSQYFFFSDHFAFRLSIRDQWYGEKTVKYSTSDNNPGDQIGDPRRSDTTSSFQLLLGLTFFF